MRKVFITGASSGIGKSLALIYAENGYKVGLASRNQEAIKDVAKQCEELGGKAFTYPLDVTQADACANIAERFIKDAEGIDIVIANAGIGGEDKVMSGSSNAINNIIQTEQGNQLSLDPKVTQNILASLNEKIEEATGMGEKMVILCSPVVRNHFKRLTEKFIPNLTVISHNELSPEVNVRSLGSVRL